MVRDSCNGVVTTVLGRARPGTAVSVWVCTHGRTTPNSRSVNRPARRNLITEGFMGRGGGERGVETTGNIAAGHHTKGPKAPDPGNQTEKRENQRWTRSRAAVSALSNSRENNNVPPARPNNKAESTLPLPPPADNMDRSGEWGGTRRNPNTCLLMIIMRACRVFFSFHPRRAQKFTICKFPTEQCDLQTVIPCAVSRRNARAPSTNNAGTFKFDFRPTAADETLLPRRNIMRGGSYCYVIIIYGLGTRGNRRLSRICRTSAERVEKKGWGGNEPATK